MKGDIIHGYRLTSDWKVVGGMSEVAFATKGGKEWFIKKFISPKYPTPDSPGSERVKAQRRKNCEEFEKRQRELNGRIGSKCGLGGNLVYAVDFFREGTLYYKINEKIDVSTIGIEQLCKLCEKDLLIVMKSLAHSLRIMHREGIVHGDLKPDNILIKTTATGSYTTKLIDFDDSYLSGHPAEDRELVVGTPEYYSPELFEYISDEDDEVPGSTLTTKSDIFALGVIFAEYLTGSKPILPTGYSGTYSAVADGKPVRFKKSKHLTPQMEALLQQMLQKDPAMRPDIDAVFNTLKGDAAPTGTGTVSVTAPAAAGPMRIVRFVVNPTSARRGDTVMVEWDVENAKEIRLDGFPVVRRGCKRIGAKEQFALTATSADGKTESATVSVSIITDPKPEEAPTGRLRGAGLGIARK